MKVPVDGSVNSPVTQFPSPSHSPFEILNSQENKVGVYLNKFRIMSKYSKYILKLKTHNISNVGEVYDHYWVTLTVSAHQAT